MVTQGLLHPFAHARPPVLAGRAKSATFGPSRPRSASPCRLRRVAEDPLLRLRGESQRSHEDASRRRVVLGRHAGQPSPVQERDVATGATVAEVEAEIREAIAFHVEGLREDGLPIPAPSSRVDYVEIAA